ncbi:glycosyltransferase family 39 protein [Pelagicoccus enzymogenes]|uniref:glycosyltransferase family 39 protein n=1 Tax=Pelagicoccus enzymogenes TaxID=2773457 RepID=UPI00280FB23A|nr:glycosyltransferase family 39 protein [Pelagicoccus enzymogenes]MDQ8197112.1 glycosyltransferase family 39 protein [Pelagicoccus enzymogenes]
MSQYLRLGSFLVVSVVSLLFGFVLLDPLQMENAFVLSGYANMVILSGLLVAAFFPSLSLNALRKRLNRSTLILLTVCLAAALFMFTREGGGFKITFDEYVITNVSKNLNQQHIPFTRISVTENVAGIESIDKRPLAFPFVLSLVHGALGYSYKNVFFLNFFVTAALLFLVAKIAERLLDRKASYLAILLACASPLLTQNSSGGGFELFNALWLFLVAWLSMNYWEAPSPRRLFQLVVSAAFASHIRYESALIVIPVAGILLAKWIQQRKVELPWLTLAIPPLFMTLAWQQLAIASNPGKFQYETEGSGNFSLSYLMPNLEKAFEYFFIPSAVYPSSPWVSFLGIATLLSILAFSLTRGKTLYGGRPDRGVMLCYAGYITALLLLILCFFMGDLAQPISSRLALPFVVLLTLLGGIGLSVLYSHNHFGKTCVCGLTALSMLFATKVYSNPEYTTANRINKKIDWVRSFAEELPQGNYLFVTSMPHAMEVFGYNSIYTFRARQRLATLKVHMDLKTYNEIYFVQNLSFKTEDDIVKLKPLPNNTLGPAVSLEQVQEVSLIPFNLTRISRITDIDIEKDFMPTEPEPYEPGETVQFRYVSDKDFESWRKSLP